jgi:predicted negative regulator of RcsB-dependent stress response
VTGAGRFVRERSTVLLIAAGLLVAAVVVVQVMRSSRTRAEQQASVALQDGEAQYASGNPAEALNLFKTAMDRYGNTWSGKLATLRAADCQLELGNSQEAKTTYERALSGGLKDGLTRSSALRGLAGALDGLGQHDVAGQRFLESAEVEHNPMRGDDLISAGFSFLDARKGPEARAAFQKLIESYPEHPRIREARDGLERAFAIGG